jgi:hypothetical protein
MRSYVGLAASLVLRCNAFVPPSLVTSLRTARPMLNRRQLRPQSAATTLPTEAAAPAPAAAEVSADMFWEWRGQKVLPSFDPIELRVGA